MTTLKKNSTRIIPAILLFFFSSLTLTNAYVFRVLGVSGKVKVMNGNSETSLKAGNQLVSGQTLIIESGYCGLLHTRGKTLELKSPGKYSIEDLDKKVGSSANVKVKVSDKYFDYIMGQLSKKDAEDVEKSVRKYMEVPGAVQRGSESTDGFAYAKVHAFPKNEVLPSVYRLTWEPVQGINSYTVKLTNRFDEIIFSKEVGATSLDLDFGKIPASGPDSYTLVVAYPGTDASKNHEYEFKVNSSAMVELLPDEGSANWILNGIMCEEKNLYLDALKYYELAANAEPEVTSYQDAMKNLRLKFGRK